MKILLAALLIFVSLSALYGLTAYLDRQEPIYTCQFQNMTSQFSATESEARGDSVMVTVFMGDRIFMFRRDRLTACYLLKPEDTLPNFGEDTINH